jgi:hypothetical protein
MRFQLLDISPLFSDLVPPAWANRSELAVEQLFISRKRAEWISGAPDRSKNIDRRAGFISSSQEQRRDRVRSGTAWWRALGQL